MSSQPGENHAIPRLRGSPHGTGDMAIWRSSRSPAHLCAGSRGRLPKQPWEQSRSVQIL